MATSFRQVLPIFVVSAACVSITESALILTFYQHLDPPLGSAAYVTFFLLAYTGFAGVMAVVTYSLERLLPVRARWLGVVSVVALAVFSYLLPHWLATFSGGPLNGKAVVSMLAYGVAALFSAFLVACLRFSRVSDPRFAVVLASVLLLAFTTLEPAREAGSVPPASRGAAVDSSAAWQRPETSPDSIVVVSFDALRADHLSAYGYSRQTSTELDAILDRSLVFENVVAPKANTGPSLASLLTGLYAPRHGLERIGWGLPEGVRTLAALLDHSHVSAAFISNAAFQRGAEDAGFDTTHVYDRMPAPEVFERARQWLTKQDAERPVLLWVHLFEPHSPYQPPDEDVEALAGDGWNLADVDYSTKAAAEALGLRLAGKNDSELVREAVLREVTLYDASIRFATRNAATFIRAVELHREDPLFVITADHGESMVEHDFFFWHGTYLYQPVVHVPLAFYYPSGELRGRNPILASLVDITPTLCALSGCQGAPAFDGIDLLDDSNARDSRRSVFTSARDNPRYCSWAILKNGQKLIMDPDRRFFVLDGVVELRAAMLRGLGLGRPFENRFRHRVYRYELFALESDPGERHNLAHERDAERASLASELMLWLDGQFARSPESTGSESQMDAETVRQLRSLGYLD